MKFDWNYSVIIDANAFQNADWKYQPFCTGLNVLNKKLWEHYNNVIMTTIASQITSLAVVYSTVYSDADQRKHQSFASLALVWGIHRGPVNSSHKWPVTRKMLPFDDVIMARLCPIRVLTGSMCSMCTSARQTAEHGFGLKYQTHLANCDSNNFLVQLIHLNGQTNC